MKKRVILVLVIAIIIIIGGYFIYQKITENNFSEEPIEGISEELINTEKEAVNYAIKELGKEVGEGFEIDAQYVTAEEAWLIRIFHKKANDIEYHIILSPNGTVVREYSPAI